MAINASSVPNVEDFLTELTLEEAQETRTLIREVIALVEDRTTAQTEEETTKANVIQGEIMAKLKGKPDKVQNAVLQYLAKFISNMQSASTVHEPTFDTKLKERARLQYY
ncbi:hypothetical protein KAZ57_02635 [Patescibacteria group bacterium]|nr:hypothetical protein [Patescibacteria group bacterium]